MSDRRPAALPPLYYVYAGITAALAPLLHRQAKKKLKTAGLPRKRRDERAGTASVQRPLGPLIWLHAVSVGELQSVLGMIDALLARDDRLTVLVTTTTTTAAEIAEKRLPARAIHQFAPLDTKAATSGFLKHWAPDLAIFVESEIWPHQIVTLHARDIPVALVNARLSESSIKSWRRLRRLAEALLSRFNLVLCQTDATRATLQSLCGEATHIETTGDLKRAAAPLPADDLALARLRRSIGKRNVWLAASTHIGEDSMLLEAHHALLRKDKTALLVLMPRHPDRGDALSAQITQSGLTLARRSKDAALTDKVQVYLADTLGETGLFFRLCRVVFVGGSFVPVGGHNPYEPAHFDCAILHGPLCANFKSAYDDMDAVGAAQQCADQVALGEAVIDLLEPGAAQPLSSAAKDYVSGTETLPDDIAQRLLKLMQ